MVKILIIGVGGCGCNTINRLARNGLSGCDFLAMDTDTDHLGIVQNKAGKLALGKGKDWLGDEARKAMETAIGIPELAFIFAGMGANTGALVAPIAAEIAKKQGALTIAFATIPFKLERARRLKANGAIASLAKCADTVILMENDRLVRLVPNLPMNEAFASVDKISAKVIIGLIGSDFEDLKAVFKEGGFGFVSYTGSNDGGAGLLVTGKDGVFYASSESTDADRAFMHTLVGKSSEQDAARKKMEKLSKLFAFKQFKCSTAPTQTEGKDSEHFIIAAGAKPPDYSASAFKRRE